MGPQPTIAETAERCGVADIMPSRELSVILDKAKQMGQPIHFLPLYRPENKIKLLELIGIAPKEVETRNR